MSRPNRLQRQHLRDIRAFQAVQARKRADVWEQARLRVVEFHLPPSCKLFVDAIAERHVELGKECRDQPVFIGYGDGTEAEKRSRDRKPVERPRHPNRYRTLTEVTGLSRRSVIRAAKLCEGHDVMPRRRAGELRERTYECRTRAGVVREVRVHAIGRGGCDAGGIGLANAYWPWGMDDPDPPLPRRPPPGPEGRPQQRRLGDMWDRHEAQRRASRGEAARGP